MKFITKKYMVFPLLFALSGVAQADATLQYPLLNTGLYSGADAYPLLSTKDSSIFPSTVEFTNLAQAELILHEYGQIAQTQGIKLSSGTALNTFLTLKGLSLCYKGNPSDAVKLLEDMVASQVISKSGLGPASDDGIYAYHFNVERNTRLRKKFRSFVNYAGLSGPGEDLKELKSTDFDVLTEKARLLAMRDFPGFIEVVNKNIFATLAYWGAASENVGNMATWEEKSKPGDMLIFTHDNSDSESSTEGYLPFCSH